jgi:adenosylcobinamide kinase / adenosylcobinamide-phosphate guanylyltransferase
MNKTQCRWVTLVLGGARSGKSRFAQKLAEGVSAVAFLATARPTDAVMEDKIRRHQLERPKHWRTLEEPLDLAPVFLQCARHFDMLLIDCLTLFVANILEADETMVDTRIEALVEALRNTPASVVLVSNEVGSGIVPDYPAGRRFRDLLGEVNQRVASLADNVVLMVAGLPLALKGQLEVRRP